MVWQQKVQRSEVLTFASEKIPSQSAVNQVVRDWLYIQLLQFFFRPLFEQSQQSPIFEVSVAVPSETQEGDDCCPKRCPCKVLRPELGSLVRPEQKCAPIAERENRDSNALRFDSAMKRIYLSPSFGGQRSRHRISSLGLTNSMAFGTTIFRK